MSSDYSTSIQKQFIAALRHKLGGQKKLVDTVANDLDLTASGAYKKINGASKLSIGEVFQLAEKNNLSLDKLLSSSDTINGSYPFHSDSLILHLISLEEYWGNILNHLNRIRGVNELSAIFLANEVPFFYYLQFPHLLNFKNFVWNKTRWNIPDTDNNYPKTDLSANRPIQKIIKQITGFNNSFSSTEIWNPNMLHLTYMQLSYFIRSGSFHDINDIMEIVDDIDKMLVFMQEISKTGYKKAFGKKEEESRVNIYLNELVINSELIYIKGQGLRMVYNKYDPPNYLRSSDSRICDHLDIWLDDVLNHCSLISEKGQRERNMFFRTLFEEHDSFKSKVEGMVKAYYYK